MTATAPAAVNIATFLAGSARSRSDEPAMHAPVGVRGGRIRYRTHSFAELDGESDRIARGLSSLGIGRGVRTVLMVRPSFEFFALTFGLLKAGTVLVMVDPGLGVLSVKRCLAQARPEAFVGIPVAHAARVALGWGRGTVRRLVTVGRRFGWGGATLDDVRRAGDRTPGEAQAPTSADETAAILFTSGSTGPPKGVVATHGLFVHQTRMIREMYGIEPGEIDLPTFPLFGLYDPALGMTTVVPVMDPTRPARVDARLIVQAIEEFRVTNMFGSPALVDRVARYGEQAGVRLPTLRRVISAGAPVPPAVHERFGRMLAPGVEIHTPYGATEALPVATIGSAEVLGETRAATEHGAGICVGRPVEGVDVKIVRISDDPIETWDESLVLPAGETGEIVVSGPIATREYLGLPEATRLAKIADPAAGGGGLWHRMGDLGSFDEKGRLWFHGRKGHRVTTNDGRVLFSVDCEAIFDTHPDVFRSALVGVGGEPVLVVEPEQGRRGDERLVRELLELGARYVITRHVQRVLFHPAFPVDVRHNAKIGREKLAIWAKRELRA